MPRRPHVDPPIEIHIQVPKSLLAKIDQELQDPFTGKLKYGARTKLVVGLLRAWLRGQDKHSAERTAPGGAIDNILDFM